MGRLSATTELVSNNLIEKKNIFEKKKEGKIFSTYNSKLHDTS